MSYQKSARPKKFVPKAQAKSNVTPKVEQNPTNDFAGEGMGETQDHELQRLASGQLDKGNLLLLQRTIGNQAVQRLIKSSQMEKSSGLSNGHGLPVQRDLLDPGRWGTKTKGSFFKKRGKTNPIIIELDQLIANYNSATPPNKAGSLGAIKTKIEAWLDNPKNKKNSRRGALNDLLKDVKTAISKIPAPTLAPTTSTDSTTPTVTTPTPTVTTPTPTTVPETTSDVTTPTTTTPPAPVTPTTIFAEINGAADAPAIKALLLKYKNASVPWATVSAAMKSVNATAKTNIREDAATLTQYFALATSGTDKGEALYFLGGTSTWKVATMGTYSITHNDQREGLVRLNVFEAGAAGHKQANEVDTLIGTHLATFVENNLTSRGKIEGRIAVLGTEDWDLIGRKDYGDSVWDGGKKRTLNAFVDRSSDPPRIFVSKDRGNAGTAIHEGCHLWGHSTRPINSISHDLNEGITEYFARKVCNALTPVIPRTVYGNQFRVANQLVTLVGEAVVGSAFFDADIEGLKTAFNTKQGENKWDAFIEKVEASEWSAAITLATGVPTPTPSTTVTATVGTSPTPGSLIPITPTDSH